MSSERPASFRILNGTTVRAALPMQECVDLMVETMMAVSQGRSQIPLRTVMPVPESAKLMGVMPGYLAEPERLGAKLVCVFPENSTRGLSSHTGVVLLFDPDTGQIQALLDAAAITALRTPAATAAASKILAREGAGDLAILGAGEQALGHLEAMVLVHEVKRIRIWSRNRAKAEHFSCIAQLLSPVPIEICASAKEAVNGADLVCTTTASAEPVLEGDWISPGTHINLVGASVATSREIDVEGVRIAKFYVDSRPSAMAQAGEFKCALDAGAVDSDHIVGEIGEVHLGRCTGRTSNNEITIYKSLGNAAQDVATAHAVYVAACRNGLGTTADL
ncbi:ornithine cyclodeaminase family protein [Kineobactrum salinum]|uniref:Ornithine cyclodeaminase family protein n=1 Tax=Kineobactrum salinum TaxID=2708301 RepID=A0A6C0TZG7_9GAMM|nr:ornithine cyclodeaminase family protein [Kineobactrum salinum]QIB65048.1 ornithine cyclodeaminase family protein [Kineobactrum salinum]